MDTEATRSMVSKLAKNPVTFPQAAAKSANANSGASNPAITTAELKNNPALFILRFIKNADFMYSPLGY